MKRIYTIEIIKSAQKTKLNILTRIELSSFKTQSR